ncbi:MAG: PorT family protein [Bacteroidetes bacterium]|nr:PorT family protein [Bacteroidota bacterium]MCB0843872.1 PorT family protein [Bacteroidota bacterium]
MKKHYLFLIVAGLFVFNGSLFAQKGLKVGGFVLPQAGYLFNSDEQSLANEEFTQEFLGGMAVGGLVGYNFNDYVGVRLNVIYSQQGGKYSARRDVNTRTSFTRRQEYVKIPLMIGLNSNPGNKVAFVFYGGVQLDLLTNAYNYNDNPAYISPLPETYSQFPSTYKTYENIHFSVVGETGLDFELSPRSVVLNLRIRGDYGLVDSENKSVSFLESGNGVTQERNYWEWVRGIAADAETFSLNVGLLVGLTFNLGTE